MHSGGRVSAAAIEYGSSFSRWLVQWLTGMIGRDIKMAEIGRYLVYGAATEAQEDLEAGGIESRVELRIPNLAAFGGEAPTYVLVVDKENVDRATALISMPEVEDYESIMACPSCGSKKVVQTRSLSDVMPKSAPEDRQLLCLECEHRWNLI